MQEQKHQLIQRMQEKGVSVAQVAEAVGVEQTLLKLYLVDDDYPVPTRILDKLAEVIKQ